LHGDHDYGAHMHTDPCGADPDDSAPHYQDRKDPEQPSTDPRYANHDNEVWLDLRTDSPGDGDADTDVHRTARPDEYGALVRPAQHTMTAHGRAGTAGDRLACADVELKETAGTARPRCPPGNGAAPAPTAANSPSRSCRRSRSGTAGSPRSARSTGTPGPSPTPAPPRPGPGSGGPGRRGPAPVGAARAQTVTTRRSTRRSATVQAVLVAR